ncbi:MAG: hypothetical protein KGL39_03720 [Patescibacteria group bacterium]|nr:hypothetical protein [Patescibacteria group bacterium]
MAGAILMAHKIDPKDEILAEIAPFIKSINNIMSARVLVAVYKRPERTAGGVLLSDKTRDEDGYQGKVGLVVGMGPLAFKDDPERGLSWGDERPQIGDWVMCSVGDTRKFKLGERDMRFVEDVNIHAVVSKPDVIW